MEQSGRNRGGAGDDPRCAGGGVSAARSSACWAIALGYSSRIAVPARPTLGASNDLTSRLEVLRADDDLVGARNSHPVRRAGAHVRLARQARDTRAAKQSADDLGFLLRRHDVEHLEHVTGHG
jgi:hypothetical protein